MKRKITFALALIMLLSVCFCACGSKEDKSPAVATPRPAEETYNLAMYYVSQGKYEIGYASLLSIKDYDKAAEALADFRFLPGQITMSAKGETNPDNYDVINFSYAKGGLMLEKVQTKAGALISKEVFRYEKNLLKTSLFEGKGMTAYDSSYTFDGEGRLIEVFLKDADENFGKIIYKYDSEGNVETEEKTDFKGVVTVSKFSFDNDGKLTEKRSYQTVDGAEKLVSKCEYTYSDKGVLNGAELTAGDKVTEIGYSANRLFYNPDYSDLMKFY